jgi:hypothetical protein
MADNKRAVEVKEIAGGWISEKKGTDVPAFLKACYFVIFSSAAIYLIIYMYGEVSHSDRGPLVKQFNQATQTSEGLMYAVTALAVLFFIGMIIFVFGKPHED